jgi:hypothetical protein
MVLQEISQHANSSVKEPSEPADSKLISQQQEPQAGTEPEIITVS